MNMKFSRLENEGSAPCLLMHLLRTLQSHYCLGDTQAI